MDGVAIRGQVNQPPVPFLCDKRLRKVDSMVGKNYLVYRHTAPNGKVYIGMTGCSAVKRWNAGNGYKRNKHFNSAIQKYGWDNIKHEVINRGMTREEAQEQEIRLIAEHDSTNPDNGYNKTYGGDCCVYTEETKKKISTVKTQQMKDPVIRARVVAAQEYRDKSFFKSEEYRQRRSEIMKAQWEDEQFVAAMKRPRQHNPRGTDVAVVCAESGEIFRTIADAARSVGALASNIRSCCIKKHWTANGYHWRFASDDDKAIREHNKHATYSKPVRCVDTGALYRSIKEASAASGVSTTAIKNSATGKAINPRKYKWEFV